MSEDFDHINYVQQFCNAIQFDVEVGVLYPLSNTYLLTNKNFRIKIHWSNIT